MRHTSVESLLNPNDRLLHLIIDGVNAFCLAAL